MTLAVRPKTSDIVKYQLPDHFQTAEKLAAFLKYYYEWTEQDGNAAQFLGDMIAMKDVDLTSDQFIDMLLVQMIKFVPKSAEIDRRFLVKHIRDFFDAKGSLVSYEFIMQSLFGEEMTKQWMGDYVLKASEADFGYQTIIPVSMTVGSFNDAQGSFVKGPRGEQAKVKDVIKTVSVSGKEIELILLDNGSVKGEFTPGMQLKALRNDVPTTYYEVLNYYVPYTVVIDNVSGYYFAQTTETNAILVLSSPTWNFAAYNGLIVRMVGGTFRAVVESATTSEVLNNKIVTMTLVRDSVTGTITGSDFYLISSFLEDNHYTKDAYVTGVADYAVTSTTISNAGSLYYEGLPINVDLGSGKELSPYVANVGTGGVAAVLVTRYGKGYVVGDEVLTTNRDSGGNGFSAAVSNIDGIGADVRCILELDQVIIRNGGTGFEPGDKFEFTYDDGRNKSVAPIRLTVDTIQSVGARVLNGLRIDSVGVGYQYAKVALSANGGAPIAGFTFNAKIYPNTNPLYESSFYSNTTDASLVGFIKNSGSPSLLTTTTNAKFGGAKTTTTTLQLPNGAIYDIVPTATTTLPAGTITVKVNGYGATLTPSVNGSGTITTVAVTTGGYNYVDPVVSIIGNGYGAVLYPVKDVNGTITSITVSKGGTGYTGTLVISVSERYGAGISVSPLIGETSAKGSILTLTIDANSRGEYTTLPDVQNIPQNSTFNPSHLRYIPDPTGSAPFGENAILDFEFRVKRLELKSGGYLYNKYFEFVVPGGTDGRVLVTTNNSGQVSAVSVLNAGTGYTNGVVSVTPSTSAGYSGPGTGAQFTITTTSGKIQTVSGIVGGSGYYPTNISFSGCHGTGATFDMVIAGGVLVAIRVLTPGSSYSSATTLSFTGTTATVAPTANLVVDQGRIIGATITNGGTAITSLVHSLIVPGSMATAHPVINGNGGIKNTTILSGGTGYYSTDEVVPLVMTVSAPVSGVTATVLPVLNGNGDISGIVITNPGAGYATPPTISVAGGYVVGGVQPTLPSFTTTIFDGRLISVAIGGGGDPGFKYGTRVVVTGTGTGAVLSPVVNTGISRVVVSSGGSYTANAVVDVAVADSGIAGALPGIILDPAVITIMTNASGAIYDVILKKRGAHHVTPTVNMSSIPGLTGSGGSLLFFVDRNVESVTISNTGEKYTNASAVVIGDGSGAVVDLVLDKTGVIESVVLDSVGARLTRPPIVTVVDSSNYGSVSAVKITNAGTGYYKTPLVFLEEGSRTRGGINNWVYGGADLVATSHSIGSIRSVEFDSFGYDYTELPKLTSPIAAIVDNVVGFKIGEIIRSKSYSYYAKDVLGYIQDVVGTGSAATVNLRSHPDQLTLDMNVATTGDLGIQVGMYIEFVSSDTIADGTFKVLSVTERAFVVEFNGGITVTGPITLTTAKINSELFGPHGTLQYVDSGRKLLVISDATEKYSIMSENGSLIIAENGFTFETEDSYDMNDGVTYVGAITQATATPIFLNRAQLQPVSGAVGLTEKKFQSDRGRINTKSIRVGDNNKYQDYAYVITTGIQLDDYKGSLEDSVHPAGFKMFGGLSIQKTVELPVPSTFSSGFDQFISLFFTLNPSSIESAYQSENNTQERRYFQRFTWDSNDISAYDIDYSLNDSSIEDFDYDSYQLIGKFRHANEVSAVETNNSFAATYVHDDTLGGTGTTIRITKASHGVMNGEVVTIKRNWEAATLSQSLTVVTVTKAGHGLTSGTRILVDYTNGTTFIYGTYVIAVTDANTFTFTSKVEQTTSGSCSVKLLDESATAFNIGAGVFDIVSAYSANTSGSAYVYVAEDIEFAYATDRKEQDYYDLEFSSVPCSAVNGGFAHAWDSGYRFDINEPYPHPTTVNANLMTITIKEVDLVTAEEKLINHRLGDKDVIWLKNLVSDTTDFSNGTLLTQTFQPYPIFSRTENSVTVFLSSPSITGTKTGKIDVRFNAPYVNK